MAMFSTAIIIFSLVCVIIKGDGTGYATKSFPDLEVDVAVQIEGGEATIELCGPPEKWFGVGFGSQSMANTWAIIVWSSSTDADAAVNAAEYKLGSSGAGCTSTTSCANRGAAIDTGTYQVTQSGHGPAVSGEENGALCVTVTRNAVVDGADYNFPNAFSVAVDTDIIAAKGTQLDWTTATAMGAFAKGTMEYFPGTIPTTGQPSVSPVGPALSDDASDSSGICFSSDSYVLTWPNFEKKNVTDLEIYDKILTYDEMGDAYFWDELLVKLHFEENEFLNDVLVPMREFTLSNGESLTMTDNHLLYIGESGLHPAREVKIGDKLKQFDGSYAAVVGIREDVMKYPRNLITYNGNLVVNGIAISTFPDTIWGESEYWGQYLRAVMKYGYSYNIWRYTAYYTAKLWTEYASYDFKQSVLKFYFVDDPAEDGDEKSHWFLPAFLHPQK